MGLIADAYARTLAFVTKRDAPSYTPSATRPADSQHAGTNADASLQHVRKFVAEGTPARTRPVTADAAGSTPAPDGRRVGNRSDRSGPHPRAGSDATNASGNAPRQAAPMPHGYQGAAPTSTPRPGASMSQRLPPEDAK